MKLIILDRDGVLNYDSDNYIRSVDEWQPIPGSAEAVGRLCNAGYTVAVATNQSAIGRGFFPIEVLNGMHNKMGSLTAEHGGEFAHIAFCPHVPDDHCDCRKPMPGLIHQIEQALGISANDAWMVGDSLTDLKAGASAGCKTALVMTGKGERTLPKLQADAELCDRPVFDDLSAFVDWLLGQAE
ncbi:D-glycero-beta-D-manno-heptose 1,7-bisphosphate 7-phosphatase [Thalassolituus sp.]|uniref:D-glycero-beta-D-manno-heptose 1,7-bisphosphate 7-phosphatase n=1 Tax=Thalassolituus sp. TaxID=2030822 RepID=UPI002A825E58|nr:D-glycero-beta-D-manno-heptose 1,7-bisphosphate 7-phosphatase [Thalassolituus sp.]